MAIPAITNNSPAGGITWAGFTIQLYGVAYSVGQASTTERWVWWKYNNGTPVITAGPEVPLTLTDDDLVLFANKNGIGVRVQSSSFVDGELLVDGSIFTEALSTNLINSQHIVTAGLDAGVIKFGEMSGSRISVNTLAGDRILANTIGTSKLVVTDFTNYAIDFNDAVERAAFPPSTGMAWNYSGVVGDGWRILASTGAVNGTKMFIGPKFQAKSGDKFHCDVEFWASTGVPKWRIGFSGWTETGTLVEDAGYIDVDSALLPDGVWSPISAEIALTSNVSVVQLYIKNVTTDVNTIYFRKPFVRKKQNGQIILDGTLKSESIVTTGLDAGVIKFGTMLGDRIAASTITALQLNMQQIFGEDITLTGSIKVGDGITLTDDQGLGLEIKLTGPDAGIIRFPSDGTPASIAAHLDALSATLRGSLRILGIDNEIGQGSEVYLSSGVSDPTVPPTVTYGWPRVDLNGFTSVAHEQALRSMGVDNGDGTMTIVTTQSYLNETTVSPRDRSVYLETVNLTTGAVTRFANDIFTYTGFNFPRLNGITKVGANFFIVVRDATRSNNWYVYIVNSVGTKTGEWLVGTDATVGYTGNGSVGIASSNADVAGPSTEVVVAWVSASNQLNFRRYSTAGAILGTHILTGYTWAGVTKWVVLGNLDNGDFVVNVSDTANIKRVIYVGALYTTSSVAWTRYQDNEYQLAVDPTVSSNIVAHSLQKDWMMFNNVMFKFDGKWDLFLGGAQPTRSDDVAYIWRDSNSGGTGTHETLVSPIKQILAYPNRAIPIINTPAINNTTNADSVDSVWVYTKKAGDPISNWARWEPAPGVTKIEARQSTKTTSATATPPLNTFASANLTPGAFKSEATFSTPGKGAIIRLEGDGKGRAGPLVWDKSGAAQRVRAFATAKISTAITANTWTRPPLVEITDSHNAMTSLVFIVPPGEDGYYDMVLNPFWANTTLRRIGRFQTYAVGASLLGPSDGTEIGRVECTDLYATIPLVMHDVFLSAGMGASFSYYVATTASSLNASTSNTFSIRKSI